MSRPSHCIFSRRNYCLILASVILLTSGFALMTGEGNTGSGSFITDIYSFRRITLAPLIILAGYALMIYAIMTISGNPNKSKNG